MLYRLVWAERRSTMEIQELWGRATHEIKTPIAGIKAFLETLRTQDMSREDTIRYAGMALKQVNRQQRLAENILIGRRLNGEDGRFNMSIVDLSDFLREFLEDHDLLLVEAQVRLETAEPAPPRVHADRDALRVIASNLVDNAVKYSGGRLDLTIRIETRNRRVHVVFRDNGPGFEPSMSPRLFDAYRHLSDGLPKADHGTGMGLHISRRLARRMGGDLAASSQGNGQGAEFRLILRRAKEAR
jgi:signal transduction histidine kinase